MLPNYAISSLCVGSDLVHTYFYYVSYVYYDYKYILLLGCFL